MLGFIYITETSIILTIILLEVISILRYLNIKILNTKISSYI